MVEMQLFRSQIYDKLGEVKFNNENSAKTFYHITEQTWFQQYSNKSLGMLKKLTAKIKKGITQGKYGTSGASTLDDGWKRFLKPLQGANKKQRAKSEYQEAKEETPLKEKITRKQKTVVSPSGKERTYNPASRTKREYEKEVKNEAVNYSMPDF